jgi:hypothetical protein
VTGIRDAAVVLLQELGEVTEDIADHWRTGPYAFSDDAWLEVSSQYASEGHALLAFIERAKELIP